MSNIYIVLGNDYFTLLKYGNTDQYSHLHKAGNNFSLNDGHVDQVPKSSEGQVTFLAAVKIY